MVPVVTRGDVILDVSLSKIGGKGLFVSEVEQTLQRGEADLAVHSLKDVPPSLGDGLVIAAMPRREDPRDVVISRTGQTLAQLPQNAVVGTSSLRRVAQIRSMRPDLQIVPLRGNVDTRIRKLQAGDMDAIILAAAGLHRLGRSHEITEYLDVAQLLPAVGQGVLGIECRAADDAIRGLLSQLSDEVTVRCAQAERTMLNRLGGSCQVPIGGYAEIRDDGLIWLRGLVASPDTGETFRAEATGDNPVAVGNHVSEQLLATGAAAVLAAASRQ